MNITKKLGRVKQWAGEKMGGEVKTTTSEDFKQREAEMKIRDEGFKKVHNSMNEYVKHIGKTTGNHLPIDTLGQNMLNHGQEFSLDSDYGQCLVGLGDAQMQIGAYQERYIRNTKDLLESLEGTKCQLKEYDASKQTMERRRIAYDASVSKMEKAKSDDYGAEEEARRQKVNYDNAVQDVSKRIDDIQDGDRQSAMDLHKFLEAEVAYHKECLKLLSEVQLNWPGPVSSASRIRSNTGNSLLHRVSSTDSQGPPAPVAKPLISSRARTNSTSARTETPVLSRAASLGREISSLSESATSLTSRSREYSPDPNGMYARTPLRLAREEEDYTSNSTTPTKAGAVKKAPPPPPPSRSKKPAVPPPMKRSEFSNSNLVASASSRD